MAHIKGPWTYDAETHHIVSTTSFEDWTDIDDNPVPKRVVCLYGAMGGDDSEADKLLMIAAPSMLCALQWAESFIAGFEGDDIQNIDGDLAVIRATIAAALGSPTAGDLAPIPAAPENGPYSPELAEAFRQGARELCNSETGDRIHIDANARVEECEPGDGGAIVHCTIYVSDREREILAGEEDETDEAARIEIFCGGCGDAKNPVGGSKHTNWQCANCAAWNVDESEDA